MKNNLLGLLGILIAPSMVLQAKDAGKAVEALKGAGLIPGKDVKILSVDTTSGAFRAMLDGTLNVIVESNPLLAPQVYEATLKAANGESLPKRVPSKESVFHAEDANLQQVKDGHA